MNAQGQAAQLNQLFGPGVLGGDTQKLFTMLMQSPAFQSMLQNYSLQGNQLSQNLTAGLAQRGLTGTGVGTIANSLGQAVPGFMQTQARGDLFKEALMAAMQNLGQRQSSFTSLEEQRRSHPGFLQTLAGGLAGGLGQMLPYLHLGGAKQQTTQQNPAWSGFYGGSPQWYGSLQ